MIPDPQKVAAGGRRAALARKGTSGCRSITRALLDALARHYKVPTESPMRTAAGIQGGALLRDRRRAIEIVWGENGKKTTREKPFEGLVPQMQRLYEQTESEFTRNRIRALHEPAHLLGVRRRASEAGNPGGDGPRTAARRRELEHPADLRPQYP